MSVLANDGTGMPRTCANHTPSGSIDAAARATTSILRGRAAAIIG